MNASSSSAEGVFARFVHAGHDVSARWQRGVDLAVELVDGCDHAGVTVAARGSAWSAAASDEVVRAGDAMQYELGEGPCLDSVRAQHTVHSHDLNGDRRWPRWAPRAVEDLGVRAMLSLLLFTERDTLGALNLYGDRVGAFDGDAIAVAHTLADQLAVAAADAQEIQHRKQAMAGRTIIGQAQGILMERYDLDADRAFEYLRRISQDTNHKLVEIASRIVATRQLPGGEESSSKR